MKATQDSGELRRYAMSGMAAFLPGMVYMVELMQRQLTEFREQLASMQGIEQKPYSNGQIAKRKKPIRSGWEGMTVEERKAEMRRRLAKGLRKKAPLSAAHKDHPDHAKWVAKMGRVRKEAWARKTKAEKEQWKAAIQAGKAKKKLALAS